MALKLRDALFIDIGSTTADLIPIVAGRVASLGYSDAERLASGELVYTGMTRSFVMALASRAPFHGAWTPLMNEYFASSADVHRILGDLPEGADKMPTADGREKTVEASRARLARMIGHEADDADAPEWEALAAWFAEAQIRAIADAAFLRLSRSDVPISAPVVAAGIGEGVVAEVARRIRRPCVGFSSLIAGPAEASHCAPAAAVALLAARALAAGRLESSESATLRRPGSSRTNAMGEPFMRLTGLSLFVVAVSAYAVSTGDVLAAGAPSNDYPTSARAEYVFACMKVNGDSREALGQCSCSIDVIASLLPYDAYVAGETVASMDQAQGQIGTMFRNAAVARDALAELRRAQAEAEVRCF